MLKNLLPVDIVLAPEWWNKHLGITFDREFFFHPLKRVETEQKMEKALYDRWGKYGLGNLKNEKRPEVGAVHLASGFLLSEMIGCKVQYTENHPPLVVPANHEDLSLNSNDAFRSEAFKNFSKMMHQLKSKYGYLVGDVNWSGILNIALDLRSGDLFTDMILKPDLTRNFFRTISNVIDKFTAFVQSETGTSSISVNRSVRHFSKPVFLHSECSHTMISTDDYENGLLECDINWSKHNRPFGIHYCGNDPQRYAKSFAKIPHLDFLDLGWGGDVKLLREYLPDTFFNIRLSPVEIINRSHAEIRETIIKLVHESYNPQLTGVCCINMDDQISDDRIDLIFETVGELRKEYGA